MLSNYRAIVLVLLCLTVIWVAFPSDASAQRYDKKTTISVNRPFEIPGKVLPPGKYVIRLFESLDNRNVVQVMSTDEQHTYALVLGIPDYRLEAPEEADITFYEAERGAPLPLHAWFYEDSNFGVEFVYPKRRAVEIATVSEEHVIATVAPEYPEVPVPAELKVEPLVAIEPGGREVELPMVHPEPAAPALAEAAPVAEEPAQEELPRTASSVPLLVLAAFLAATAAAAVRSVRVGKE
jgi:hypothetical protein